ncbi:hypothetical protein LCGC14_1416550 [marine sediment metagenome]|uniref:Uncharacterized protein n=1 Tax=marine sediment metagenome TaxID=412755 RepID=A0A0F9JSN9_9ZZZZ
MKEFILWLNAGLVALLWSVLYIKWKRITPPWIDNTLVALFILVAISMLLTAAYDTELIR